MLTLKKFLCSSVGKKFVMAASGLALVLFVIAHLAGNLSLYRSSGVAFNTYAHMLESLGPLLIVAELGLIVLFAAHVVTATGLKMRARQARPERYAQTTSKGGTGNYSNVSSRNMIATGIVLFGFVIIHIASFKYGPGIAQGYVTEVNGHPARDLHRLVVETFKSPINVAFYVAVMLFLGLHLRHGFWSAFQSLGLAVPRLSKQIYCLGVLIALVVAAGFLFIPLWIYFGA